MQGGILDGKSQPAVILSERSESKDLHTKFALYEIKVRRFFDSLRSLRMTYFSLAARDMEFAIKNQIEAQRSGFDLEKRRNGMSETWPFRAGARDMELAKNQGKVQRSGFGLEKEEQHYGFVLP